MLHRIICVQLQTAVGRLVLGLSALTVNLPSNSSCILRWHLDALAGLERHNARCRVHPVAGFGLTHDMAPSVVGFKQHVEGGPLREQVAALDAHLDDRYASGNAGGAVLVPQRHRRLPDIRWGGRLETYGENRHNDFLQRRAAMKVQYARTVRCHGAWPGELGKLPANPGPFCRDHETVAIGHAIAQEAAIVDGQPVALGLLAHIPRVRVRVEKEAVIRGNDHLMEAVLGELVDSKADLLERAMNGAQGSFRVVFLTGYQSPYCAAPGVL